MEQLRQTRLSRSLLRRTSGFTILAAGLLIPGGILLGALIQVQVEVSTSEADGTEMVSTGFEGAGEGPLHSTTQHPTLDNWVTMDRTETGPRWAQFKGLAADGSLLSDVWQLFNMPDGTSRSQPAFAFWSGTDQVQIQFAQDQAQVSFMYSSGPAGTVEAFDANGNSVGSQPLTGNSFLGSWHATSIDAGSNRIHRIVITGGDQATAIDDLVTTRLLAPPEPTVLAVDASLRPGACRLMGRLAKKKAKAEAKGKTRKAERIQRRMDRLQAWLDANPKRIRLNSRQRLRCVILSSDEFDAAAMDVTSVTLNGASPRGAYARDIDGDGRPDCVLKFRARDLVDVDSETTELCVEGQTLNGAECKGTIAVSVRPGC